MKHRNLSRAVAIALLGLSGAASAITDVENNSSIPFSFSSPGARSLGMGGAFIAVADDATAAYTNPAGLTGLGIEQQIGVEVRHTGFDDEFVQGGSASADASDLSGLNYDKASDSASNLSFLSWVMPRDNWALALYRHELVNYQNSYSTDPINIGTAGAFILPYDATTDLEIINYGASFGYKVNDHLSLGVGLSWYDFEIETDETRYNPQLNNQVVSSQRQDGGDHDFGFNLGLLFRGSDSFSIGLTYRSAPEFEYRATNVAGPAFLAGQLGIAGVFTGQLLADKNTRFKAPDTLGVGFNWRPSDNWSFSLDVNHVNYSNGTESMQNAFLNDPGNPLTITTQIPLPTVPPTPAGQQIPNIVASEALAESVRRLQIDNTFEPRLGMEYAFADKPLFLRAGIWHEARHTIRFEGDPTQGDPSSIPNAVLFSTGKDEMHYSLGAGWVFEKFQIDAATDQSDRGDIYSVSGVWRF